MKVCLVEVAGFIALVDEESSTDPRMRNILAAMTNYEGGDLWQLVDVRLAKHRMPSPYFGGLFADDLHAVVRPESPEEADLFRSRLREYVEDETGALHWCTFDGIVRGEPLRSMPSWLEFDQAGFFSREEGLSRLCEIQLFWARFDGDPAQAKIDNPNRQPSIAELSGAWFVMRLSREAAEAAADYSSSFVAGPGC